MKNKKRTHKLIAMILILATIIPLAGAIPMLAEAVETDLFSENFESFASRETGTRLTQADGFASEIPSTTSVAKDGENIGFLLPDIDKNGLFTGVKKDGSLPRKTFSIGHAFEKRYYLEARRITK